MTEPDHPDPPSAAELDLVGQRRTRVDADDLASLPVRRRTVEMVCSTGRRDAATWGGAPLPDLLSLGTLPPTTTHLVVGTGDGYAACVGVEAALSGLLAWTREGRLLAEATPYVTRFVAPGVDGVRFVKGVARIEAVALSAGEDPADYESLDTDSPDFEAAEASGGATGVDG